MKKILILITLISGLVFTSFIKNKTRLLEKKLANLNNEINVLNSDLNEASLDFEYLTTPKNISFLAKNFLHEDLVYYKKAQINNGSKNEYNGLSSLEKFNKNSTFAKLFLEKMANNNLHFGKNTEIERLSINAKNKDNDNDKQIKKSKKILHSKKAQRWAGLQVIKAMLGLPIIPVK